MNVVTGATGLLGSHVMLELLRRGKKVRALYRSDSSVEDTERLFGFYNCRDLWRKVEWVRGDVLDTGSLLDAFSGASYVYHCAAVVSYHSSDRAMMYKVNVEGTANVIAAAMESGVKKLCHVSSIAALRRQDDQQYVTEEGEWVESDLNTHYGITKHLSEMEVWRGVQEGLEAVIINPGLIIGPGDFTRSSSGIFSRLDEGFSYYPPGGTGLVGVKDVARLMVDAAESGRKEERFIAVSENWSMQELFTSVSKALNRKAPHKEARPWMLQMARIAEWFREVFSGKKALITRETVRNSSKRYYYSAEKSIRTFDMEYTPVRQSVEETAGYYRQIYPR